LMVCKAFFENNLVFFEKTFAGSSGCSPKNAMLPQKKKHGVGNGFSVGRVRDRRGLRGRGGRGQTIGRRCRSGSCRA